MQVLAVGNFMVFYPAYAIQKFGFNLLNPNVGGLEQDVT